MCPWDSCHRPHRPFCQRDLEQQPVSILVSEVLLSEEWGCAWGSRADLSTPQRPGKQRMGIGYPQISGTPQIRKVSSMKTTPHPSQSAIEFGSSVFTYIHIILYLYTSRLPPHIPPCTHTGYVHGTKHSSCGLQPRLSELWVWPQHRFGASCIPAAQGQDSPWIAQQAHTRPRR